MRFPALLVASVLALASCRTPSPPRESAPSSNSALVAHLSRIFEAKEFTPKAFGPHEWLSGGAAYAVLEPSPTVKTGSDLVRYECASGARSVLVPAERFVPEGAGEPLSIESFAFSKDESRVLLVTNVRTGFRLSTAGDAYVVDVASGRPRRVGADAPETPVELAKFAPDGASVTFVRENDVWRESLSTAGGPPARVTSGGSKTIIHGASDWVYEEEIDVTDGYRVSPDGKRVAFLEFDTSPVGRYTLVDTTSGLYPKLREIPYPKAGTPNSLVRLGIAGIDGGEPRFVEFEGDPRDHLIARFDWADENRLVVQRLDRAQRHARLLEVDAATGAVREARREDAAAWVEVVDRFEWIAPGRSLLYSTEADGRRRPIVVTLGESDRALATGSIDAIQVLGADARGGVAYFLASPSNATQAYLYRARLDGSGAAERVTPESEPGTHAYDLSPDRRFAIRTHSRFETPPRIDLVSLPDHRVVRTLVDNAPLARAAAPFLEPAAEFFSVEIEEGVSLDGWLMKPKGFDEALAYPAIVYVYGEPWGQTVLDSWGGGRGERMMFHRALADLGYLVVSFDNRGTPAPKGAAWRKIIHGGLGLVPTADQAKAIAAFAAERPYVDATRIGVWGRSGGGMNTLNLLFRHPEIYKAGVSVAPVSDQRYYDTIYTERYMGLPSENADGYRDASPLNFAAGLEGHLLIVHGTGDDNVHVQNTEKVIDALVALKKPFELMLYPNRSHQLPEGKGTQVHLHALLARYFSERLPAGGRAL